MQSIGAVPKLWLRILAWKKVPKLLAWNFLPKFCAKIMSQNFDTLPKLLAWNISAWNWRQISMPECPINRCSGDTLQKIQQGAGYRLKSILVCIRDLRAKVNKRALISSIPCNSTICSVQNKVVKIQPENRKRRFQLRRSFGLTSEWDKKQFWVTSVDRCHHCLKWKEKNKILLFNK